MAFFTRNFGSDASFHPLFRLLDDYESYSRGPQGERSSKTQLPLFQPKFDVRELEDAYELHGELAGINKEDVHIEFSDPHTLHVRGRVERSYTSGTPPAGAIEGAKTGGAITQSGEEAMASAQESHKATVEDENPDGKPTEATPSSAVAESSNDKKQVAPKNKPADAAKYWVSERSVGEFHRTFNFPGQVDQDGVSASLKDGVLTVRVPKAPKKDGRRRIEVTGQ